MTESGRVRIAAVCGAMSRENRTKSALLVALEGAAELDVETQLVELFDYDLPILGAVEPDGYPPDVLQLKGDVENADGILVGTPEYYGSLTGALKNALDLIGADVLRGKLVGLVGIAGGDAGAINSLNTMRIICRNLHCWALPQEVSVANANRAINSDGTITDPKLKERLLEIGRNVARFTILRQRARQEEFVRLWEGLSRW